MKYDGMTVNERLYTSGLVTEFDKAVQRRDALSIIKILRRVDLGDAVSLKSVLEFNGLTWNPDFGESDQD